MATLEECLAFLEEPGEDLELVIKVHDHTVKFIDDYGIGTVNASFFAAGFEFGPTHLIHTRSFEAAWEAWVDELPTIPEDELIEAYGVVDDYRAEFTAKDPCPEYWQREAWDAWHVRFKEACRARLKELGDKAHAGECEYPNLIEGYEYQSNSSGTGIVDVGHYANMVEVDPADVTIELVPKEKPAK